MNQNEKAALREILAQRESMYRLLARLYKTEADKDLLDGLGAAGFPEEDGGLGEGFRLIADWLRDPKSEDPVTELAVDYAHTFLGAGIADGLVSYPFESVYTSPGRLVMQDAWEDVCRIYREHGLERGEQADMHEDQIGLECEFMAILAGRALEALEADDEQALEASLADQHAFLTKHLLNWVPRFTADVTVTALTDFYHPHGRRTSRGPEGLRRRPAVRGGRDSRSPCCGIRKGHARASDPRPRMTETGL